MENFFQVISLHAKRSLSLSLSLSPAPTVGDGVISVKVLIRNTELGAFPAIITVSQNVTVYVVLSTHNVPLNFLRKRINFIHNSDISSFLTAIIFSKKNPRLCQIEVKKTIRFKNAESSEISGSDGS
jgi:hypothetical protein